MFENNVIKSYTGADAFGEIFIMLLVAFLLGWFARLLWDRFFKNNKRLVIAQDTKIKRPKKIAKSKPIVKKEEEIVEKEEIVINTKKSGKYEASNGLENDDLKIIEGIGPKIEILLKGAGIKTWQDLAKTKVETLKNILKEGGDRFAFHEPTTWPEQASLAASGNWQELEDFQVFLSGGRVYNSSESKK